MSMSGNGPAGAVSEINVTPLIDVLLVLLIIFMVILPQAPDGMKAAVPQPARSPSADTPPQTIVVQVTAGADGQPTYKINQTAFGRSEIAQELYVSINTVNTQGGYRARAAHGVRHPR